MKKKIGIILCLLISALLIFSEAHAQFPSYGGRGGNPFSDRLPPGSRIAAIEIRAGIFIDAIRIIYVERSGREGYFHRGGNGGRLFRFDLVQNEDITGISGRCGDFIDSLRIHTNLRTSALYGGIGGAQAYSIGVPAGYQFVGFVGQSGIYLDRIGMMWDLAR